LGLCLGFRTKNIFFFCVHAGSQNAFKTNVGQKCSAIPLTPGICFNMQRGQDANPRSLSFESRGTEPKLFMLRQRVDLGKDAASFAREKNQEINSGLCVCGQACGQQVEKN